MFALFKDGKMIAPPRSKDDACAVDAMERGLTMRMPARVVSEMLKPGVQIVNLDPKIKL